MKKVSKSAKRVKAYTLSTCFSCNRTKKFLKEHGIKFDYIDIDLLEGKERDKILNEVLKLNKKGTFPTIVIDGKVVIGHDETKLKEVLSL